MDECRDVVGGFEASKEGVKKLGGGERKLEFHVLYYCWPSAIKY